MLMSVVRLLVKNILRSKVDFIVDVHEFAYMIVSGNDSVSV